MDIQALREANNKGDSSATKNMWQPKASTINAGCNRVVNPAIGNPPAEFVEIDLTDLEKDLESVLYANDEWAHRLLPAVVDWARADSLTKEQMEVQEWWGASSLPAHGLLETHILNDLVTHGKPYGITTVEDTLKNCQRMDAKRTED